MTLLYTDILLFYTEIGFLVTRDLPENFWPRIFFVFTLLIHKVDIVWKTNIIYSR